MATPLGRLPLSRGGGGRIRDKSPRDGPSSSSFSWRGKEKPVVPCVLAVFPLLQATTGEGKARGLTRSPFSPLPNAGEGKKVVIWER